eukprot:GSMAST32.ASY1.ANO1.1751.1 assembled CDS
MYVFMVKLQIYLFFIRNFVPNKNIKVLKYFFTLHTEDLEEFKSESAALARLHHPNIMWFYGIAKDSEDNLYIITEYLETNLKSMILNTEIEFSKAFKFRISLQIAQGMRYLHYEDIERENDSQWVVKLCDFGLSKLRTNLRKIKTRRHSNPSRIAEVSKKLLPTIEFDVYSYGILLWVIQARRIPYTNINRHDISKIVQEGQRPPLNIEISEEWSSLITSCWHQDPEKRPDFRRICEIMQSFKEAKEITRHQSAVTSGLIVGESMDIQMNSSLNIPNTSAPMPPPLVKNSIK